MCLKARQDIFVGKAAQARCGPILACGGNRMKKMDYTIGFQGGRPGPVWTAKALTDRAKVRTPDPITFEDRQAALKFLKDSQAEGYRFAGAWFVDPEQRMVRNRYFVIGASGELVLSGEDNGPRDTVWEVGDVKPVRDRNPGTEAVIENILQGPGVRERFGCDLAFVLRLQPIRGGTLATPPVAATDPAKACPCGFYGKSVWRVLPGQRNLRPRKRTEAGQTERSLSSNSFFASQRSVCPSRPPRTSALS